MGKITFEEFVCVMSYSVPKYDSGGNESSCIEIEFDVDGCSEYQECWMGKMVDRNNEKKYVYWFGLVPDGSQAYDFDTFEQFANAKVFHGKSIKEIWGSISVASLCGGLIHETLPFYLEQS